MARGDSFADLQRRAKAAEQQDKAESRSQPQAAKADAAQRAAEEAQAAVEAARGRNRQRLQIQAAKAHTAARQAEVDELTAELQHKYAVLDGILAATLGVDDFVDLESLRVVAEHPPFPREDLRVPIPDPPPIPDLPIPVKREPQASKVPFGRKQNTAEASAAAEQQYATEYWAWKVAEDGLPARRAAQKAMHADAERGRLDALAQAVTHYEAELDALDKDVAEQNAALDGIIAGLGPGEVDADAVQEYVAIVLANSVYPEWFPVTHSGTFEPATAELSLKVVMPGPEAVPTVKGYRYLKPTDEIIPLAATHEEVKDRYAGVVHRVALRSLHEVFHADGRELIGSISLDLGTQTISRATGKPTYVPLVAVAATREDFEKIDLSAVDPSATLEHLGAVVSKDPQALVPIAGRGA